VGLFGNTWLRVHPTAFEDEQISSHHIIQSQSKHKSTTISNQATTDMAETWFCAGMADVYKNKKTSDIGEKMTNLQEKMIDIEEKTTGTHEKMAEVQKNMTDTHKKMADLEKKMNDLHQTMIGLEGKMISLHGMLSLQGKEICELNKLLENIFRVLNRIDTMVESVGNGGTSVVPMDWSVRR
jgi:uncharacterized coiled-coil DUF342 family protein